MPGPEGVELSCLCHCPCSRPSYPPLPATLSHRSCFLRFLPTLYLVFRLSFLLSPAAFSPPPVPYSCSSIRPRLQFRFLPSRMPAWHEESSLFFLIYASVVHTISVHRVLDCPRSRASIHFIPGSAPSSLASTPSPPLQPVPLVSSIHQACLRVHPLRGRSR